MKITSVETFIAGLDRRNYLFVRVQTDEGIHGIGEAYSCGPDEATAAVVADFETWLIGKDPSDIEALWHLMYAGSRFPGGSILNSASRAGSSTRSGTSSASRWACRSGGCSAGSSATGSGCTSRREVRRPRRWPRTPCG